MTNDELPDGSTPDVSDVSVDLDPTTPGVQTTLVVAGEGEWVYDPSTGEVTFTPEPTFEDSPTPIDYVLTDLDTGETDPATITVVYEIPPVADNETSTGNTQGDTVSIDILDGDTDADGTIDPTTVDLVVPAGATDIVTDLDGDVIGFTVPGEGVWLYDDNTGELSFDPEEGYTGNPTPVDYTVDDNDGNSSNVATVTVEYTQDPPVAENDINPVATDIGDPTVINVLTNDELPDGSTPDVSDVSVDLDPTTPGVQTTLTVTGEGEWVYDPSTGEVTFTPEPTFEDSPTPIDYVLTDLDTGETDPATITVVYEIPPVADNETSTGNNQGDTVSIDILDGDTDADGTIDPTTVDLVVPVGATDVITDLDGDVIGFTVPGEGTWSYDEVTGELSFDPEEGYTGNLTPVDYTVDDNDGNTSNVATVTVEFDQDPPVANDNSSTGNDTGNPVTLDILANDTLADGSTPTPADVILDLVVPTGATDPVLGLNGNTIGFTVSGEGVWLYDEATGEMTFTPEVGFTNDPTPVDYNLTDVDTGEVTASPATITIDYEIELPVSSDDESLGNATGTTASVDILGNDMDPDGNLDPETVNLVTPTGATNIVTDADGDVIGFDVPGEGTWSYDAVTGLLEFTPIAGFVEDPTPIEYTVDDNDGNTSNVSQVTVDYIDVADLSLTKIVVDGDTTPLVGTEITFEIRVFNDGPQDATGVEVTDILPSGYDYILNSANDGFYDETTGIWTVGSIESGDSAALYIDVLVNATGDYLNVAEVTSSDVFDIDSTPDNIVGTTPAEDDEASAIVVPVIPMADLSLTKVVVDNDITPLVGSEISFEIQVFNDGPQDATGVQITDLLPSGYDYILDSATAGSYDETTGIWNVGNIDSNDSETLVIDVLVNATGDYRNITSVTSSDIADIDSTPNNIGTDPIEDDEAEATVTPVVSIADLSLTKIVVDGDTTPLVGEEITFEISVTNDGPQDATGVEVTDLLPSGFDYERNNPSTGIYNEITGIWTIGNLASGQSETLVIDVIVEPTGDYVNVAEVSASNVLDVDSTPGNGDATEDDYGMVEITPIQAEADLSLVKTVVDNEIRPEVGDEIVFQITVTNNGPDTATGVQVVDQLPVGFDFVEETLTSGTYDEVTGLWDVGTIGNNSTQSLFITVIVNEPTGADNEFINSAEVIASDQIDPNSTPDNDDITENDQDNVVVFVEEADLSLTKTVSDTNANVGDVITFTLQIDNAGADTATGVALEDILPIGYSNITNITNGGNLLDSVITWSDLEVTTAGLTITYDATVNTPTLEEGEYLNIAQITALDQFDPNSTPNNDDGDQSEDDEANSVIATPTADIGIVKTVDVANPAIGDVINFTITVTNSGSVNATSVEISESLPSGYAFNSYDASSGTYDSTTGIWTIPSVTPIDPLTTIDPESLTIEVTVLDIDDYANTAFLLSLDQIDGNTTNDSGSEFIAPVCLTIDKKFSPNGNGENEFFNIDCISSYPKNTLEIYNRWGNIVYEKEGYDNTFEGISNGRAVLNKDQELPVGTYYYVLDLGDGSEPRVGWLYIAR